MALCREIEREGRWEGNIWCRECKRGMMEAKVQLCNAST